MKTKTMKIQPINNHLIVEPVEHDRFISSTKGTYEEVGVVIAVPFESPKAIVQIGDKVYFDSWLAAKYPTGEGDKTFWLVNYEDIRAVQKADTETEG